MLQYKRIFNDISGGLMAAIIGLPMGLAFGVHSGLGAQAGIYCAIALALVASAVGGTKTLISDPTGPMTVVAATIVATSVGTTSDLTSAIPLILGTFLLAGIFELIFGIVDLGRFIKYIPYPVVSSFMTGIGVIIISMQLFPLLGHESPKGVLSIISNLHKPIFNLNFDALLLGAVTLSIIYILPLFTKKVPSILIALIAGTLISNVLHLDVPIIGSIPREIPNFHLMDILSLDWITYQSMIFPAILLGSLGVIDSLLTSVVADKLTSTQHNSRKTIIGQGLGNIFVSLIGGIPGAGATMGTVTNINSGGVSRLSGFLKGIFLLIIIIGVADSIEIIPLSVLAAILLHVGISIIDQKGIKMLTIVPKEDLWVWSIVLLFTVFNNLLNAVLIGFILACILFIFKINKSLADSLKPNNQIDEESLHPFLKDIGSNIYIQELEGPLFFGFAKRFQNYCQDKLVPKYIILRMNNVPFIDQSGLLALEQVLSKWKESGSKIYFCEGSDEVSSILQNSKLAQQNGPCQYVHRFDECLFEIKLHELQNHNSLEISNQANIEKTAEVVSA